MNTRKPTVAYITGRRGAIAQAIALEVIAPLRGLTWDRLTLGQRKSLQHEADAQINDWIANGVLAQFLHEYRES